MADQVAHTPYTTQGYGNLPIRSSPQGIIQGETAVLRLSPQRRQAQACRLRFVCGTRYGGAGRRRWRGGPVFS
jgi:hypothetical protein